MSTSQVSANYILSGTNYILSPSPVTGTDVSGNNLILSSGQSTGSGSSQISFQVVPSGSAGSTINAASTAMTILSSGSIGIGTLSPGFLLDVAGQINATEYFVSGNQIAAANLADGITGSGEIVLNNSPTLVSPDLGTPTTLIGTNITGTALGLTAGNVVTNANLTGDVTSSGNVTSLVATSNSTLVILSSLQLPYSQLTGTVPTWNQNTTGNAATVTTNANLTGPISSLGNTTSITSQTGTGTTFVMSNSPALVTPTLGAASATSISFSSTAGIIGSTTNDSAASGSVGEFISSDIAIAHEVALITSTANDITNISLSAGDWDVWGAIVTDPAAGTTVTQVYGWISTMSATLPTAFEAISMDGSQATVVGALPQFLQLTPMRVSLANTTTIYLSAQSNFTGSTHKVYGRIQARRVR